MFKPDFPCRALPKVIGYPFGFTPPLSAVELAKLPAEPMSHWERIKFAVPWFGKDVREFNRWRVIIDVTNFGAFDFGAPQFVGLRDTQKSGKIVLGWDLEARMSCTVEGMRVFSPDGEFVGRSENTPYRLWPISMTTGDILKLSYTLSA